MMRLFEDEPAAQNFSLSPRFTASDNHRQRSASVASEARTRRNGRPCIAEQVELAAAGPFASTLLYIITGSCSNER